MTLDESVAILERYCNELDNWSQDSNCSTFDADMALTKEKLETLVCYLEVRYWSGASAYLSFLEEMSEDLCIKDICEGVEVILSSIKENI